MNTAEAEGRRPHQPKPSRGFFALLSLLWRELGSSQPVLLGSLATLTIATLLGLAVPSATKIAVDYVILDTPGVAGIPDWWTFTRDRTTLLWLIGAAMLTLSALAAAVGMWGRYHTTRLTKLLQARMRRRAFARALDLPLVRVQALKSGGISGLLREDAGSAGDLLFALFYNPWRAIIQLVGTLLILASVDWRLVVGGVLLVPAVWITHRQWINRIRPIYRDLKITRSGADGQSTEAFAGIRVVRGFARGPAESARFMRTNHLLARQEMLVWWRSRILEIVWALLLPAASAGVLLYGGSRVMSGDLTVGDVMMFSAYVLMLLSPLETLTSTAASVQTNLAAFDRVLDLMNEPREFENASPTRRLPAISGRITFDNVTFAYPRAAGEPGTPVLQNISLDVPQGWTVALVGPSGSGKTTLSNLVARFYDPTLGRVLVDGIDLRDLPVADYRAILGIVEQDVFLFDGTIADNIAYGRRSASRPQIAAAALAANADAFINALEHGYDTVIGERGVRLSGGQRQRLAIARALLADPRILILDEATSNLDAESESLIQASLAQLRRGRTCFIIAHRLSTIRNADLIVVLDQGRIVEQGRHDDLINAGGRYARLLRTQVEHAHDASSPPQVS